MVKAVQENSMLVNVVIGATPLLWAAGLLTSNTFGGLIHVLPVVGIVLFFMKFSGEETTRPGDKGPRFKPSSNSKR